MTTLLWDVVGEKRFQTGVDRGVLYLSDHSGVVWNGLTSVEELNDDDYSSFFLDGIKYSGFNTVGDFSARLKAFTYPDEFEEFEGIKDLGSGLSVHNQMNPRFGLSYRTKNGNDIDGVAFGYRIHILYNLLALTDATSFSTIGSQIQPVEFNWNLFGMPENIPGYHPTCQLILDSTEFPSDILSIIEDILYGTEEENARLPSFSELLSLIQELFLITIVDHEDGTWSAIGPDNLVEMLDSTTFQISEANAIYIDADTYEISSTEL